MEIPHYPEYAPIDLDMRTVLHPRLSMLPDGVSEYTFAGLYLFRDTYDYRVSLLDGDRLIITGTKGGTRFFMLPCGFPDSDDRIVEELFGTYDYLKGLSEANADPVRVRLEQIGLDIVEDRDNFDYLYLRDDLASLSGRKYHKKRNHVNAFINNYEYDERPLKTSQIDDARRVLEQWHEGRTEPDDYTAATEALDLFELLELKGYIVYVDGEPAAYTFGEPLMRGRSFVVHFEKAVDSYRGIYQFINKAFATILPRHYTYINREQDLGDEGLRQSKMTYRPCGFVKKYRVNAPGQEQRSFDTSDEQDQASA
jgi:hypothetical protein